MRAAVLVLVACSPLAGCGACEPDRGPPPAASGASASASAPELPILRPGLASATMAGRHPPKLACRAIAVDGDVHLDALVAGPDGGASTTPLLLQGLVPTEGWLDLAKAARFVAKDPRTARETTFRGPGRARACVALSEESWVAAGGFDSSVGAGESPGAEEWVVTPFGVVRYDAAKLSVDVGARDARVGVATGEAFVWAADDVAARSLEAGTPSRTDDGWLRAGAGLRLGVTGAVEGLDAARPAVARCSLLGQHAHDLGAQVMAGKADAGTIEAQVGTRRLARAACAVAGLRVATLPASTPPDTLASLNKVLADANTAWSAIPSVP